MLYLLIALRYLISIPIVLLLIHVYINTRDFQINAQHNALLTKVNYGLSVLIPTFLLLMGAFK